MCSAIAFPTSTNCSGTSITILGIDPPAFWTTFDSLFYQIFEDLSRMRATPYETRWEEPAGVLRYAVFASPAKPSYIYSPEAGLQRRRIPAAESYVPIFQAIDLTHDDADR